MDNERIVRVRAAYEEAYKEKSELTDEKVQGLLDQVVAYEDVSVADAQVVELMRSASHDEDGGDTDEVAAPPVDAPVDAQVSDEPPAADPGPGDASPPTSMDPPASGDDASGQPNVDADTAGKAPDAT